MFKATTLMFFSFATFLVVIAPGPGMLFVISRNLTGGRKAGVISALGTSVGIALHIMTAAFGLSLIIYATAIGFKITKWAGGIYLLFLAFKAFTHRQELTVNPDHAHHSHKAIFWQGVIVNALNPKVALFLSPLFHNLLTLQRDQFRHKRLPSVPFL